ncbi:MAG: hypothetical protein ACI3YH_07210 [Eubacteriales bacterium]
MTPIFTFPALEQMQTPLFICNARGIVIFKNAAAVRRIRLPRRNTSVRSHLRQAEEGELDRIAQRRRPSILTLHSGDRPVRALVVPYVKDEKCGPSLASADAKVGEVCSLWIFPATLQVFSTSVTVQYIEGVLDELSDEICGLVKQADRISGMLPGKEKDVIGQKMDRRVQRILATLETLPQGRWFDLRRGLEILLPILRRQLEIVGVEVNYSEEDDLFAPGQAVDLPRMSLMLLHLLSYCVPLADDRAVSLCLCRAGERICLRASFKLNWPPYTVTDSDDLRKLCLLLPTGQLELLILDSLCKGFGTPIRYTLTDEAENNLTLTLPLPLTERGAVRMPTLNSTELLFLSRDLEVLFGAVWEEKFTPYSELVQ